MSDKAIACSKGTWSSKEIYGSSERNKIKSNGILYNNIGHIDAFVSVFLSNYLFQSNRAVTPTKVGIFLTYIFCPFKILYHFHADVSSLKQYNFIFS